MIIQQVRQVWLVPTNAAVTQPRSQTSALHRAIMHTLTPVYVALQRNKQGLTRLFWVYPPALSSPCRGRGYASQGTHPAGPRPWSLLHRCTLSIRSGLSLAIPASWYRSRHGCRWCSNCHCSCRSKCWRVHFWTGVEHGRSEVRARQ